MSDHMTEKESLALITEMIGKARNAWYDTGISAILWGALIAICSLEKLAEFRLHFELPVDIFFLTFLAVIPQIIISRREKKARGFSSYHDRYQQYIWMTFGLTIFLLIFIINVISHDWIPVSEKLNAAGSAFPVFHLYEYTSSFFMLLYGVPTFITGMSTQFRAMIWGGLACWVAALLSLFTPLEGDMLLTAFCAIVAWLIPGIILYRKYRKAKQGLSGQAHV